MMAKKSRIDEDCEVMSVVADPWNLKLKPTKPNGVPLDNEFRRKAASLRRAEDQP